MTSSERCGKLAHSLGVEVCGKQGLPSSSPFLVEFPSSLCSIFFSLSFLFSPSFPPPPPWDCLKISAANSRARTAAWDWLGDEVVRATLPGAELFSGDP